jgi:hypothetical protein
MSIHSYPCFLEFEWAPIIGSNESRADTQAWVT